MGKRILFIEQESHLARFLLLELEAAGYEVEWVQTHEAALEQAGDRKLDLFLFDLQAGYERNVHFFQKMAAIRPAAVVIVLASPEELAFQSELVQQYAVSTTIKPFVAPVLLEQIAAIFRGRDYIDQHCQQMKKIATHQNLEIDLANQLVFRDGEQLYLTRREYDLLVTLIRSREALSREELLEKIWKYENPTNSNIVDVYIRYLRNKIDQEGQPSYIETVRGIGYKMREL